MENNENKILDQKMAPIEGAEAELVKVPVEEGQVEDGVEYNEVTNDATEQDTVNEDDILSIEGAEFEIPEEGNE